VIGFGLIRSIPLALADAFTIGVVISVLNIPLFSVIQAKVPSRLMGRVMSVFFSLILAAAPFGAFFAGSLATATSIGFVYVAAGILVIGVAGVGLLVMRTVRELTY
jgi:hypothetical protein